MAAIESPCLDPDADHHLWRNGRLWWIAFTVHHSNWTAERVRFSLGTADLEEARQRRDAILAGYPEEHGCELSIRVSGCRRRSPARRRPARAASCS